MESASAGVLAAFKSAFDTCLIYHSTTALGEALADGEAAYLWNTGGHELTKKHAPAPEDIGGKEDVE